MKSLSISLAALLLSLASGARADCALGASYQATNSAPNTVTVCLLGGGALDCGTSAQAMLRQDVATGGIVQLANFCAPNNGGSACYLDECVPAGSYRYGLAVPFTCDEKGCGSSVPYFTTAQVTTALGGSCARSPSDPGPTATSAAAPWGTAATETLSCSSGCSSSRLNTNVAMLDLGAIAIALVWLGLRKRA